MGPRLSSITPRASLKWPSSPGVEDLADELERLRPSELLYSEEQPDLLAALGHPPPRWLARATTFCLTKPSTA
jgi:hypothetical protein